MCNARLGPFVLDDFDLLLRRSIVCVFWLARVGLLPRFPCNWHSCWQLRAVLNPISRRETRFTYRIIFWFFFKLLWIHLALSTEKLIADFKVLHHTEVESWIKLDSNSHLTWTCGRHVKLKLINTWSFQFEITIIGLTSVTSFKVKQRKHKSWTY